MKAARAAIAYWAVVFALGFVLGTIRTLWLVPATLAELPVMLAATWWASGWLVRRFAIATGGEGLAAGGLAFALLMAAECGLAVAMMGQTPAN